MYKAITGNQQYTERYYGYYKYTIDMIPMIEKRLAVTKRFIVTNCLNIDNRLPETAHKALASKAFKYPSDVTVVL